MRKHNDTENEMHEYKTIFFYSLHGMLFFYHFQLFFNLLLFDMNKLVTHVLFISYKWKMRRISDKIHCYILLTLCLCYTGCIIAVNLAVRYLL